jgi:hypothetical protein
MAIRVLLFFTLTWVVAGCKNEPFEEAPLAVTKVVSHVASPTVTTTLNYYYRDGNLYTFSSTGTDTISMKFDFRHGDLKSIITDSTDSARKITTFYKDNFPTVTDSTFLYYKDTVTIASARVVIYDGNNNPTSVDIKTWTDKGITEKLAELTWEDGNVVRLVTYDIVEGVKSIEKDVAIAHDGGNSIYSVNRGYLFTLPLDQLYWLSKNNPVTFNEGKGDKTYVYWYNKLGYPSNYQDNTGIVYGVTYTQIR